jgi:hypothetical protein
VRQVDLRPVATEDLKDISNFKLNHIWHLILTRPEFPRACMQRRYGRINTVLINNWSTEAAAWALKHFTRCEIWLNSSISAVIRACLPSRFYWVFQFQLRHKRAPLALAPPVSFASDEVIQQKHTPSRIHSSSSRSNFQSWWTFAYLQCYSILALFPLQV